MLAFLLLCIHDLNHLLCIHGPQTFAPCFRGRLSFLLLCQLRNLRRLAAHHLAAEAPGQVAVRQAPAVQAAGKPIPGTTSFPFPFLAVLEELLPTTFRRGCGDTESPRRRTASGGPPPFDKGGFLALAGPLLLQRPLSKGAVSRRLTEDCVLRSKTYAVNKVLQTLFISYISPAAKYNPPPQCAHWGTSFQKEACPLRRGRG